MKASLLVLLLAIALVAAACVKAPVAVTPTAPTTAAEPSLSQEIGTLESSGADSGIDQLDQLDSDANSINI